LHLHHLITAGLRGFARRPAVADPEIDRDQEWSRLMVAAQDGDRGAYERLLREILPFLRAVVASHHRHPDRIDDVIQDVLLSVHRVRHTYDPARPFRHWLLAITRYHSRWCNGDRSHVRSRGIAGDIYLQ
jgi:DNA-directed RNA polymerase specialized sigma24 family protein